MITLMLVILVVVAVISAKIERDKCEEHILSIILGTIAAVLFVAILLPKIQKIATANTIDQSIEMYQEENAKIEESIGVIVRGYLNHEKEINENLTDKEAINYVRLYPDIESNTLVKEQIEVYVQNNEKIKELRQQKIDLAIARWDVYFGR